MASISGVGDVDNGALIRYASLDGTGEGVVVEQSDPTMWVHSGNAALLSFTVRPVGSTDTVEVSGSGVREVVSGPDDHSRGLGLEMDDPEGAGDVQTFMDHHGRREFAVTYREGDSPREVTVEIVEALGAILNARTADGNELGIPYSVLESVRVPEGGDSDE